jgi:hypothetical protein
VPSQCARSKCIGQDRSAVVSGSRAVVSVSENEPDVVPTLRKCGGYAQVGAVPVEHRLVEVQVVGRCLEEDPQRLPRRLRNQVQIRVAALHLDEAAVEARHSAEPICPQPAAETSQGRTRAHGELSCLTNVGHLNHFGPPKSARSRGDNRTAGRRGSEMAYIGRGL